jgi:hypothetical protein
MQNLKAKFTIPTTLDAQIDARARAEDKTRSQVVSELLAASLDFAARLTPPAPSAPEHATPANVPATENPTPQPTPKPAPHLHRPRRQAQGFVYFLQPAGKPSAPVKVGFSERSIVTRLRNLQTASPEPLAFLAAIPGTRDTERALHQRFAASRICGEWHEAGAILEYLGGLGREAASHA